MNKHYELIESEVNMIDICIIGGGASGIIAAISARMENPNATIHILEKNDKLGKKLLATGNGRCNFSNTSCASSNEILKFFNMLGIKPRVEEQGRIYPYSGQAQDVLNAFEAYLNMHDIKIHTGFVVENLIVKTDSIDTENSDSQIDDEDGDVRGSGSDSDDHVDSVTSDDHIEIIGIAKKLSAKNVLIATGGKAGPQFGCIGDGYKMARVLGHTVTKTIPALSPIECEGNFEKLKGIRAKALAKLVKSNIPPASENDETLVIERDKVIASEIGEVQFTDYGLSGICIFNLSRDIKIGNDETSNFSDYTIVVDLLPEMSLIEVERELTVRRDNLNISPDNLLLSLVPKGLVDFVLSQAGVDIAKLSEGDTMLAIVCEGQIQQIKRILNDEQIQKIAYTLKNLTFTVTNVKGWQFAQCTSGGIPASEIDMDTMESKIAKGVYFAGELLDYDGPCGGFNLNNAWDTGIKAGKAMAGKAMAANV